MSATPRLLAGQAALARWVMQGGRSPQAPWGWRMQLRWHAYWFDRLTRQQAARIGAARPAHEPVFVLGFWRSGTTLLHEWVSALPGHAAPLTWQCFNPATFVLTGPPRGAQAGTAVQRPMDTGVIAPGSPQEDEFALLLQGAPSLYRGFIDPRRLHMLPSEVFSEQDMSWVSPWLQFLAGVEQQAGGARLVLKSPNHSFRLQQLLHTFPNAPLVWIARPAAEVWHSNLRMWQSMIATYGLWSAPSGELEAFLEACMRRYVEVLERARHALPPGRVTWVEFNELYRMPEALLQRVAARLPGARGKGLPPHVCADIVHRLSARPPSTQATPPATTGLAQLFEAYDAAHARARGCWSATP